MTLICVPVFVNSQTDWRQQIDAAQKAGADLVELRADTATTDEALAALAHGPLKKLVTLRSTDEGGKDSRSDAARAALLTAALERGAALIDIEFAAYQRSPELRALAAKAGDRTVLSYHNFAHLPADLPARIDAMLAVPNAVVKIAYMPANLRETLRGFEFNARIRANGRASIVLAMGEHGVISRLLAAYAGQYLTFATTPASGPSAPGQPSVDDLLRTYRFRQQQPNATLFGVIGHPIGHSLSPHLHNAAFAAVGFAGIYVPLLIAPDYDSFANTVDDLRTHLRIRGLSITIPHKENAIRYAREHGFTIDPLSQHIGVVNTFDFNQAPPLALNTDYAGSLDALVSAWHGQRESLAGKRVAVLGAGGAARAIVAGLAHYGATVVIYNRTLARAEELAAEFNNKTGKVVAAPWANLCKSCCEAYINCTPLGMYPNIDTCPIAESDISFSPETVVFDTVYNPLHTKLLKLAQTQNARIVTGSEMFIRQAAIQFKHFTGHDAPMDVFRHVMSKKLG